VPVRVARPCRRVEFAEAEGMLRFAVEIYIVSCAIKNDGRLPTLRK